MTKRILSMVLVLCMVFTILPTWTLAQTVEPSSITSNVVVNEELHTTDESNMANDETQSSKDETTSEGEKTDQIPDNGAGLEVTTPAGGTGGETTTSDDKAGDEIPSIEDEEVEPIPTPILITAVTALGEDVATQTIEVGSAGEPTLPTELTVTYMIEENPAEIAVAVTWESDKAFSNAEVAEFIYTATLQEKGYTLAKGVSFPQITVNVVVAQDMMMAQASPKSVIEQFTELTLGENYYFDLSTISPTDIGEENVEVNANVPDTTVHYLPFTYVGTINSYNLSEADKANDTASVTASLSTTERSLFISDYAVIIGASWNELFAKNLIYGKDYMNNNITYSLRSLSVGYFRLGTGDEGATPENNEWDTIFDKEETFIKNATHFSWGQDPSKDWDGAAFMCRGKFGNIHYPQLHGASAKPYNNDKANWLGWRPALEIKDNPEFKTITLELGDGHLGTDTSVTSMNIVYANSYVAPDSIALTRPEGNTGDYFKWLSNDNNTYEVGATVPNTVTTLTAQWADPSVRVAQIGEITYPTLQVAVTAVENGETIEILSDITLTETVKTQADSSPSASTDRNYTISLGDYTIDSHSDFHGPLIRHNGTGALTITGGTNGGIEHSASSNYSMIVNAGIGSIIISGGTVFAKGYKSTVGNTSTGTIIVDGGTVTTTNDIAILSSNIGTVQVKSGTVSATEGGGTAIQIDQDSSGGGEEERSIQARSAPSSAVTVSGGEVSATGGMAIYNKSTANITISGGEVSATGGMAIGNKSTANITISGGEISATGMPAIINATSGLITVSGDAKVTGNCNNSDMGASTVLMAMMHLSSGPLLLSSTEPPTPTSQVVLKVEDTATVENTEGTYAVYFADEEETKFPPTSINVSNVANYYQIAETATVGRIHPDCTYTISGTIKGSDTNKGIAATLQLKNSEEVNVGASVTANSNGDYSLQAPNGTYSIEVSMTDYQTATIDNVSVNNVNVSDKDLILKKLHTVTVTGGTTDKTTATQGETITVTATIPNDKLFKNWTSSDGVTFDEPTHNQTTFLMPNEAVTITATLENKETGTIIVTVTEGSAPVTGATVKVVKKSNTDTVVKTATETNGSYSITGIPYGVYSLVVEHGEAPNIRTNTSIITINAPNTTKDVTLLSGKKDTKVEVVNEGTPPTIAVNNLDKMFESDDGVSNTVEIKLQVTDKTVDTPDKSTIESEIDTSKETIGVYLDAKLIKSVNGAQGSPIQPPNNQKLKIVIDVPVYLQNKESYSIVRVHTENEETYTLKLNAEYNSTYHTLTFMADKFSTYAIVYSNEAPVTPPTGGGSSGGGSFYEYYDIKIIEGENGSISPDGGYDNKLSVREYRDQTFTFTPDKGYMVSDVIVDGKSKGKLSKYTFENVKEDHTIEVVFAKPDHVNPQTGVVLDKDNHFAYMSGVSENVFEPNRNITRAETVVMFSRLLLEKMDETKVYSSTFTDITGDEWYANTVGFMEQFGIVSGYEDGTFGGNKPITRAEFATIASRFDALVETDKNIFPDVADDYWAISYINSAVAKGWISGYPDGTFKPTQSITRAEAIAIVNRMLERVADQKYITVNENHIRTFGDVSESHWAYYAILEASNGHQYHRENTQETWISLD